MNRFSETGSIQKHSQKSPALHGFIIKEKISTRQKKIFQSKLKKNDNFFLKDQKYLLLEYITEIKNKA